MTAVRLAQTSSNGWGIAEDGVAHTLDGTGGDAVHTLTSEGSDASEDGTGRGTPIVMAPAFSKRPGQQIATKDDGTTFALTSGEPPRVMPTLRGFGHGWQGQHNDDMSKAGMVRRLTPTECERLQGFPDGWTEPESDSARYRMLGNAVCVPVAQWIGARMFRRNDPSSGNPL